MPIYVYIYRYIYILQLNILEIIANLNKPRFYVLII